MHILLTSSCSQAIQRRRRDNSSRARTAAAAALTSVFGVAASVAAGTGGKAAPAPPTVQYQHTDKLEIVHEFRHQMPVGIVLTSTGRRFVSYPRWEDKLEWTLAELKGDREVPWPRTGAYQKGNQTNPKANLVSLQGIVMDGRDRLWVLDTGTVNMKPVQPFVPKLIGFNTTTGAEEFRLAFAPAVVPPGSYLNDLRVDLTRGAAGTVYITDSGKKPALIVVDIAGKRALRRLANYPSVFPEKDFVGITEGRALFKRPDPKTATHLAMGADGIALSPRGDRLYYTALAARRLYSVSCAALADPAQTDEQVALTVKDMGEKGVTDGMETDDKDRVYTTNWEQNAILRRYPNGLFETVVHNPRLLWPDTMNLTRDGTLYFISNQLQRQAGYNEGRDRREKPYLLVRMKVDARPMILGDSAATKTANRR